MPKKLKIVKRKKVTTPLRRTLLLKVLLPYLGFIIAIAVVLFTMMGLGASPYSVEIAFYICFGVLLAVSVSLLFTIPVFRAKQGKYDLKNYDFSPYAPTGGEEIFECAMPNERYIFRAAPFDEDGEVTLDSAEAFINYMSQFDLDNLLRAEQLGQTGEFVPFFCARLTGGDFTRTVAKKRVNGEFTEVTFTPVFTAVFSGEGLTVCDKLFPYDKVAAFVYACFDGFAVSVRVICDCGGECVANFAAGGRIFALLKKYGVKVINPEVIDYVLADPERAFKQTGLQTRLKKLK